MSKDILFGLRDGFTSALYKGVAKPFFFLQDPESVHDTIVALGRFLGSNFITRSLTGTALGYQNPMLSQTVAGIYFKNPIGLAAGFDKNAQLTDILPHVGFGFEEVGSITGEKCIGNPKPRLWRLKKSKSLAVYYGLKNDGAETIAHKLKKKRFRFPVGISIAKTNSPDTVGEKEGIADYGKALYLFNKANIGSYYTINISCPNAYGGEPFVDAAKLDRLLAALAEIKVTKPVFLKMPAEISEAELDAIITLARTYRLTGFISTNLAKDRKNPSINPFDVLPEKGGLSGKVVEELSNKQIAYLYKKTRGEFVIMGCGGVFTAEDAYKKIRLGASLIQLITGIIFEGPQAIGQINRGLVRLLKRDGFNHIREAVGVDVI